MARRRRHPGDPETDVLTRLIEGEQDGARLSEPELLQNCIFILNAGHETTTNLIGNGLHALLEWPDQKRRLIADPALIPSAVEEILRFESSNQLGNRRTTRAVRLGARNLPAGSLATLCIGAANRDPEQFPDPDRFDVGAHAESPSGVRRRPPSMRRHDARAPRRARSRSRASWRASRTIAWTAPPVRGGRARFRGFQSLPAIV